jgi:hypothetical protein
MAAVTKNRNFFSCQFLLYYKSKGTQILTAATLYMAMSSLTFILSFSVRFFQPVCSVYEYYEMKITSKSFAQKFELK